MNVLDLPVTRVKLQLAQMSKTLRFKGQRAKTVAEFVLPFDKFGERLDVGKLAVDLNFLPGRWNVRTGNKRGNRQVDRNMERLADRFIFQLPGRVIEEPTVEFIADRCDVAALLGP
jgi:hypothetical protein